MKRCGNCAELIQDQARACRFCGRKVQSNNSIAALVIIGVLSALLLSVIFSGRFTPEPVAEAAAPKLADSAVKMCRGMLALAVDKGVIKARPQPNRINVDDRLWAMTDADTKDKVMQAVACDLWQTSMPPGKLDYVVAYGHRSGKRIQMLSSTGMSRE